MKFALVFPGQGSQSVGMMNVITSYSIHYTKLYEGVPMSNVIVTVDQHGNTSAASVPLALDAAVRDGRIQRGQKVMLEGVGGGFTWGAVLLQF